MITTLSRKLRSQSGVGMLEVLVGAAIIGITLPFAVSNFSQNIRAIDSNRISAAIDQLDEELATNIATQAAAFLRASALSTQPCRSNTTINPNGAGINQPAFLYFDNRMHQASTSAVNVAQLTPDNIVRIYGAIDNASGGTSYFTPFFGTTILKNNPPGADTRLAALRRCLPYSNVNSSQSVFPTGAKNFRDDAGLYFCAMMSPATKPTGTVASTSGRFSLEQMRLFGEFLFVMRDPAGNPTYTLTGPPRPPTLPRPAGAASDVVSCGALSYDLRPGPPNSPPPAGPASPRLGTLYYTLYWVANENGGGVYRDYSGTVLITDKATGP